MYLGSNSLRALGQIINLYLISKFLSVEQFGIYTFFILFLGYYAIFNLGTISGLNIELPYSIEKKRNRIVDTQIQTVNTYYIILFLLTLVFATIYYYFANYKLLEEKIGFGSVVLLCILTQYEYFLLSILRAKGKMKVINIANVIFTFMQLSTLILIVFYGVNGLFIKLVLSQFIYISYLTYNKGFKITFKFNRGVFFNILKVGIPLYLLNYILTFSYSFDKLLVKTNLDSHSLGLYSFGNSSFVFFNIIQMALINFYYPQFIQLISQKKFEDVWKLYVKNTLIVFILFLMVSIVTMLLSKSIFQFLLPNYFESLLVFKISIFSGLFFISTFGCYNIITSTKELKPVMFYHIIILLFLVVIPYLYSKLFLVKINHLAIVILFGYFFIFITSVFITRSSILTLKKSTFK